MLYPNELRERAPQVVEVLRPDDNVGLRRTSVFDGERRSQTLESKPSSRTSRKEAWKASMTSSTSAGV